MGVIGLNSDLSPGHTDGFVSERFQGDSHQRDGYLLAGRHEHIHFTAVGAVGDFMGESNELVGRFTHGTDNNNDLITGLGSADGFSGGTKDFVGIGNAGSAEFLNDERHCDHYE